MLILKWTFLNSKHVLQYGRFKKVAASADLKHKQCSTSVCNRYDNLSSRHFKQTLCSWPLIWMSFVSSKLKQPPFPQSPCGMHYRTYGFVSYLKCTKITAAPGHPDLRLNPMLGSSTASWGPSIYTGSIMLKMTGNFVSSFMKYEFLSSVFTGRSKCRFPQSILSKIRKINRAWQYLICSVGGQDTSAWHIYSHSFQGFWMQWTVSLR